MFISPNERKCCLLMGTTLIFLASGKVIKKIPVWIKYGERGKVKGAEFIYRLRERGPLIFRGGIFCSLGEGEVGSVFAIKWYRGEVGVCQ